MPGSIPWPKGEGINDTQSQDRSPLSTTFYRSGPASERHRNRSNSDIPAPATPQTRKRNQSLDQTFLEGTTPPSPSSSGKNRTLDRKSVDGADSESHPLNLSSSPTPPSPLFPSHNQSLRRRRGVGGSPAGPSASSGLYQSFADDPVNNLLPMPPLPPRRVVRDHFEPNTRNGAAVSFRPSSPPSNLSASWSSGQRIISGLIHGPHFIPHLFDDEHLLDDNHHTHMHHSDGGHTSSFNEYLPPSSRQRNESMGGSTWPPSGESRAWWDSVKRVGVLSVLELERQIGLSPASMVFGSFTPYETAGDDDFSDDDNMLSEGEVSEMRRHNASPEGSMELQELRDRLVPSATTTTTNSTTTSTTSLLPPLAPIADSNSTPSTSAGQQPSNTPAQPLTETVAAQTMSIDDEYLFQNIFNAHPFAGAAFLRAFIACSFGLLLFHVHSVLSWPDSDSADGHSALSCENVTRKWLYLQLLVLMLQIPLRMEVQRSLFRVSTARDTADATNRFRQALTSSVWRTNRNFGRVSFALELFGFVLIGWRSMMWPSFISLDELSSLDTQIISINASNFLIFIMRSVLLLSLLYFVQVSVPSRASKKKGLSEGTISRLRRVTYSASISEDSLTQCAVCLEMYEEGDYLMVLPCDIRHNFHSMCIEPWLLRMNTCPLCQRGVPEETQSEE